MRRRKGDRVFNRAIRKGQAPRGAKTRPPDLRLDVTSDPANLASVRHACEAFCRSQGLDDAAINDVGLCVNEAMANITRHAYGGATDKPVSVRGHCDSATGDVTITLRDWGSGFNPESVRPKQDPSQPGGLGMVCIRCLVDDSVYSPQPDGMVLTLTKRKKHA